MRRADRVLLAPAVRVVFLLWPHAYRGIKLETQPSPGAVQQRQPCATLIQTDSADVLALPVQLAEWGWSRSELDSAICWRRDGRASGLLPAGVGSGRQFYLPDHPLVIAVTDRDKSEALHQQLPSRTSAAGASEA